MPVLTFFFIVITMASIGLPGLNGFVGEFLVLAAVFQNGFYILGACAATGIILSAIYMLWLVQRVPSAPSLEQSRGTVRPGRAVDFKGPGVSEMGPRGTLILPGILIT